MARLIWSIGVSLDSYIADADGRFDWAAPDAELHQFHNDQTRELGVHLVGRRLYETMLPWETTDPAAEGPTAEFHEIWQALPKVVFSRTLSAVEGNARLADGGIDAEVARLGDEDVAIGGAGLAAEFARRDLIDEYGVFINPVAVGGGTSFLPRDLRLDLKLVESRTFGSGVVYLRYLRVRAP